MIHHGVIGIQTNSCILGCRRGAQGRPVSVAMVLDLQHDVFWIVLASIRWPMDVR